MGFDRGELIWIYSNGGPLMLLSEEYLPYWEGSDPPSRGRILAADFRFMGPGAPATDYDRACDINDYLGILDIGEGQALVLGDEPMQTAWWPGAAESSGMLVRWGSVEDEVSLIQALSHVPEPIWDNTGLVFVVGTAPLYLFDSACPGSEPGDHLAICLPQGSYTLATALYQPDSQISVVLHRFMPVEQVHQGLSPNGGEAVGRRA